MFNISTVNNFWSEMPERPLDGMAETPVYISDDEAGSDDPSLPTWPDSLDRRTQVPENGHPSPDVDMSSNVDEYDFYEPEHVDSEASTILTPVDMDQRFWNHRHPFVRTRSGPPFDSPYAFRRQLSIQAGPSDEMQTDSEDSSSATSEDSSCTVSSATLQGDDSSKLQTDGEDYEDLSSRYQILCEQGQEVSDMISDICETLPLIEFSIDALCLRVHTVATLPTALRNLCHKIDELHTKFGILNDTLYILNQGAAELGVGVDMVNGRAERLRTKIRYMDLGTTRAKLEAYRIQYFKSGEF